MFARRDLALRAVELRLAVDPYAVLDVVLRPEQPFPLDLVDLLRARLNSATPSYASRTLALRGENLQRRLVVVLPSERRFARDWLDALALEVPVYREQSAREAAAHAHELGDGVESARIMDTEIDRDTFHRLVQGADPGAVTFAQRRYELAWVQGVLGYGDAS